jgi:hypothetical protein
MSSTRQAASSPSDFQWIINTLADYAKQTGIDLTKNPFAAKLEQSNSPEAVLELLQERERAFKEYRDGNRRLTSSLSSAVKILHAFSRIVGEVGDLVSVIYYSVLSVKISTWPRQVPFPPAKALFAGIDVLLAVRSSSTLFNQVACNIRLYQAASGIAKSYDVLLELFERLGNFLKRLEIYTTIPPTTMMIDIIVKILVEVLSVLALATTQIKEGWLSKCNTYAFSVTQRAVEKFFKKLLGKNKLEAVLQRLDRLTQDEAQMNVAQTLGVVHGLVGNVREVMDGMQHLHDLLLLFSDHLFY